MATATEIAWAAGLFEGEGCATIGYGRQPRLAVAMTDRDVVERFHRIIGRGTVREHDAPGGRKQVFHWTVQSGDDVLFVADLLWPHLGERRRERLMEIVERASKMYDSVGYCKRGHDLSVEANVYRDRKYGKRYCAICRRNRNAAERLRKRVVSA